MQATVPTPWIKTLEGVRKTNIEFEDITTLDMVHRRAITQPQEFSMIFAVGKKGVTYQELWESIKSLAVFLKSVGIEKGDRVCVLLPNTPHYVISHYAIMAAGAVVVQGNPLYTEKELTDQLNDCDAKGVISLTLFQDKVNKVMKNTSVEFVILGKISDYMKPIISFLGKLLKKLDDPSLKSLPNNYSFKKALKSPSDRYQKLVMDLDDVALLQYTGGTTGRSKGATLTHRNLSFNAQQIRELVPTVPDNAGPVLTVLPLFHSFALTCCLGISIRAGCPMILMPKFDAGDALKFIEKYKVIFAPSVPTMMIALLNHPNFARTDMSSLIASISGGAALPIEVANQFAEIANVDVIEGYGLSETSPVVTGNPLGSDKVKPKSGSIGLPAANTLIKIVDQDDYNKDMPQGEAGEIAINGPQVMVGYWNDPESTKTAIKDGWLLTGDIGYMDEEGYFFIVDRKKDIIIVSGNNVVPRDVEEVLYAHPAVLEAAVAGVPHPSKGEMVAAWIVLKEGMTASEEEIIKFCAERLAPYKIPKLVIFKEDLPKTMIGKILRRALKEDYAASKSS